MVRESGPRRPLPCTSTMAATEQKPKLNTTVMVRIETVFLFDLDGTLVDSVYQHVLAWREALDQEGIDLSVWRIHRRIGMSGGLFTNMLLRETGVEMGPERVERLRQLHKAAYIRLRPQVRPLPGARELLNFLTEN